MCVRQNVRPELIYIYNLIVNFFKEEMFNEFKKTLHNQTNKWIKRCHTALER